MASSTAVEVWVVEAGAGEETEVAEDDVPEEAAVSERVEVGAVVADVC